MPIDERTKNGLLKVFDLLQCPWCKSLKLELKDEAITCRSCSRVFLRKGGNVDFNIKDITQTLSPLWHEKQKEGLDCYKGQKQIEIKDEISKIFSSLIAGSKLDGIVLDIGCGIHVEYPPYWRSLANRENITYVGLDPLKTELQRKYVYLASIAEKIPFRDKSIDACIFATSIDHFENIDNVMREAKRIMKHKGLLFFWVGLRDLEYNMPAAGMMFFKKIITDSNKTKNLIRILLSPAILILTILDVRKKSILQDKFHFYKFTETSLVKTLKNYGIEIIQIIRVPGTNSILIKGCFAD